MTSEPNAETPAAPRWGVIALHGAMSHAGWFARLGESLATRNISFRAIDRRGSGKAADRPGSDDSKLWVEDVLLAIEEMRAEAQHIAIFGWCWGARLALAAKGAGANVDRVILAAPGLALSQDIRERMAAAFATTLDPLPLPFSSLDFSESSETREFIDGDPLKWTTQSRAFTAESRRLLERALAAWPLACPTLVILAREDRIVDNDAVCELVAGAEVLELPGGHALFIEQPDAVASAVEEWLRDPR